MIWGRPSYAQKRRRAKARTNKKQHDAFEKVSLGVGIAGLVVLVFYTGATFWQVTLLKQQIADARASGVDSSRQTDRAIETSITNGATVAYQAALTDRALKSADAASAIQQKQTSVALDAAKQSASAATVANKLNQDSFIAGSRALIAPGIPYDVVSSPQQITWKLPIQNIGKYPAVGMVHHGVSLAFDMPKNLTYAPDLWSPQFAQVIKISCSLAVPHPGPAVIFPGIPATLSFSSGGNSLAPFTSGQQVVVSYGCIGYLTFNVAHYTTYCMYLVPFEINGSYRWEFVACPIGNDAD